MLHIHIHRNTQVTATLANHQIVCDELHNNTSAVNTTNTHPRQSTYINQQIKDRLHSLHKPATSQHTEETDNTTHTHSHRCTQVHTDTNRHTQVQPTYSATYWTSTLCTWLNKLQHWPRLITSWGTSNSRTSCTSVQAPNQQARITTNTQQIPT